MNDYPNLFSPLKIGSVTIRNRVAVTAHLSNFSEKTGHATALHRHYHRERAHGGAGLLISEGLAVHPSALSQMLHARLDHDDAIEPWMPVVADVHAQGAAMFAQLNQFLSPSLNFRTDDYGGSFENRLRFLLEILGAIRQSVSSRFICGMRISADEFVQGGIDLPMAIRIISEVTSRARVDYVSVTENNHLSGEVTVPDMEFARGAFRHLARGVRHGVPGVPPVFTVGRVTAPELAEEILRSSDADVVGMTRAHIADPYLLRKAAEGRRHEIRLCIGCNQGCIGAIGTGGPLSCLQNPVVGLEGSLGGECPAPAATQRSVAVIGAGPAGMEAAWVVPAASGAPGTRISFGKWTRRAWMGAGYLVARKLDADGIHSRLVDRFSAE